jgi:phosphatidylglycerol---prolipoprotein diacylglyceryl transferase
MFPSLQIGPLALPVPALVVLAGIWAGLSAAEKRAVRHGLHPNDLYNLVLIALVAGVIAARLAYALRYPQIFAGDPLGLLSRDLGLFDPLGGLVGGSLAALIYAQRKRLPLPQTLDAITPGLAVFAIALGVSHLASGSAFGEPTQAPWGIELWGARRQPTQVYEILAAGLIFGALDPIHSRLQSALATRAPGLLFLVFVALSACSRLIIEAFRGDSPLILGGLRAPQIVAWLVLMCCLWGIGYLTRNSRQNFKTAPPS